MAAERITCFLERLRMSRETVVNKKSVFIVASFIQPSKNLTDGFVCLKTATIGFDQMISGVRHQESGGAVRGGVVLCSDVYRCRSNHSEGPEGRDCGGVPRRAAGPAGMYEWVKGNQWDVSRWLIISVMAQVAPLLHSLFSQQPTFPPFS